MKVSGSRRALKQNAEPYHARVCPIPQCHVNTLKMEVECLCEIEVLKKVNQSQWAVPTFVAPKKSFAHGELKCLGYWITHNSIQPMKNKVIISHVEVKACSAFESF